jgi:hypothetical protein
MSEGAKTRLEVVVGAEHFPQTAAGELATGRRVEVGGEDVTVTLPAMCGAMLHNK